jgi:hypothetical protein
MPVVIHEIEVVPRHDGGGGAKAPEAKSAALSPPALGKRDVLRVQREIRQRQMRVWAH